MHTWEKVSVFLFLSAALAPFIAEWVFIRKFAASRKTAKHGGNILLIKGAICTHIIAVIWTAFLLYALFIEPYWIEIKTISIETEKLAAATLRVVQISDMHCGKKTRTEKRVVEIINGLSPDVIVFTGDSLGTADGLTLFKETMNSLQAKIGKFAVLGNFDVWQWSKSDLFGGTGFELLNQNTVFLEKAGEKFCVSGLNCDNPAGLGTLLKGVPEDCFSIFLYHYSDLAEDMGGGNVDLYLSGHTHGGQVALPFYGAIITLSKFGKKYEAGMYKIGDMILYVNRGIGLEAPPAPKVRFFARPEITVFEIRPRK